MESNSTGGCPVLNNRKPVRLKNVSSKAEAFDSLQTVSVCGDTPCTTACCLGSCMALPSRTSARNTEEILIDAKDFLDQYFTSIRRLNSTAHKARWEQVQTEVKAGGTYQLTETELIYGAKLAWRNATRCIGRIQWSKLQVFDCRYVTTTSGMFEALCNHIKYSTNKGNIRSAITIFPQRTDGKHDFRVWNAQLFGYAGYKQPDGSILGDPMNVEFTEVCLKLGWKGPGTKWDILPLLLSANGHDPDYFDIPPELILDVPIVHPTYEWFEELGIKWYTLPAVANMMFDCGGVQFTAAPFNGWYMSTEIGCRNICDPHRMNMLEAVALRMGLDTRTPVSLWKDKAMIECNVAVLHSFQLKGVTIVDHHTASESFMKHLDNENRLRNGCPSDWVWIVPPLSGSATPVFHQEMALYYLKPSYEYQEPAWKSHIWKKGRGENRTRKPRRKFHFKQIARAVKFTSKLFGKALSKRIKATILFATETGKSEAYAQKLVEIFGHAFNAQIYCMSEYDISSMEHEALLLVVTSTFGNGDPPENGEDFAKNLFALKVAETEDSNNAQKLSMASSKSFIKANSQTEFTAMKKLDRLDSLKGSTNETLLEDNFGPLSNVRFAVFALGSSAYPNFCAFGQYVDNLLGELGGERLLKMSTGDEMCGQEQAFRKWAPNIFKVACETFCLDDDDTLNEATKYLQLQSLSEGTVRFVSGKAESPKESLIKMHSKEIHGTKILGRINLHGEKASRATLLVRFEKVSMTYSPGDHMGVFAVNRAEIVDGILERLQGVDDPDAPVELQILQELQTSNGIQKNWKQHEKRPVCSVREMFMRYLDITTPPTPNLLQNFASIANDEDRKRLEMLASDSTEYEDWRHYNFPNLLEVLQEFPSVNPFAPLLIAQLPVLQPRFYSISSSPLKHLKEVHLTVAIVQYHTRDGTGPRHYGVCSNFLNEIKVGEEVWVFIRRAPNFHLPEDLSKPIIVVGPGTGIAPFKGFWEHRHMLSLDNHKLGKMLLFFGCRTKELDLYRDEKADAVARRIIDKTFLALSREPGRPKMYVQNLILENAAEIFRILILEEGHFYVCGDCTMAEDVLRTLKGIIQKFGNLDEVKVDKYLLKLRDQNRYHEDIFGITLRTAEIHKSSRESARQRMASEP
ncbi:nitric oxide synthase-like protein isoform X2 [Coccinella septempunctata]|uniref:nitric oxide synthase-like protein isoform X2 n=1 Tax=Coccinella septempunctata TaxID=41139 RepID=UPI001D05C8F6|nr:nitric oxide synthase-like protein isoform X2 [Coccinella septempunctata]